MELPGRTREMTDGSLKRLIFLNFILLQDLNRRVVNRDKRGSFAVIDPVIASACSFSY